MKRWIINDIDESPQFEGIHPNIVRLLYNRGITTKEDMEEFLSNAPMKTYNPFLLKGMTEAVNKIKNHIKRGSRICIYGDYDVDGVTAICLLFEFLGNLTNNLTWYIPSRHEEGYGINMNAIKSIKDSGVDLLISVDCGISSFDEVRYAGVIGLDVIITDHHTPGERIAEGIVINPKQWDCPYPFKGLCGCGVAYKLIQALQRSYNLSKKTLKKALDLAAIATVADIVPLLDENRTIVKYGLQEIALRKRPGLKGLIDAIGFAGRNIAASDIAFVIGPHINASGRVDTAGSGLELLLETNPQKIDELSQKLIQNNNFRKSLQNEGYKSAESALKKENNDLLIFVCGADIHEGIAGIVAGKLREKYNRPALILTGDENSDILKGTGRSVDTINLYELLKTQEPLFLNFGGHKAACGFSIMRKDVKKLRIGVENEIRQMLNSDPTLWDEVLEINDILELKSATTEFGWMLEKLEPYGQSNPKPIFMIENVYIDDLKFVGKEKDHCKFFLKDKGGNSIECIMFAAAEKMKNIELNGVFYDCAGKVNMNYRAGAYNIQFIPVDFRRRS